MKLPPDLHAFIASLNAAGVKYVIVGGYAVAFHGHPRFTGDIDFFVEATPENAVKVTQALAHFGFASLGLKPEDFTNPDAVIQLGYPPNRVDIITRIEGVTFAEAWGARVAAEIDGLPAAFIARELLIRNKKAVGRAKDLGDIENL